MLTITTSQMDALRDAALRTFKNDMAQHLRRFAPAYCLTMGEAQLCAMIADAINRADQHGFNARGPVQFFFELQLMLGIGWETDPQYSWLAKVLYTITPIGQTARSNLLYDRFVAYADVVAGERCAYIADAIDRFLRVPVSALPAALSDVEPFLLQTFRHVYPQKADYVGPAALAQLVRDGKYKAEATGLGSPRGMSVYIAMMFCFGHQFENDPRVAWASVALTLETQRPASKAQRLYEAMIAHLTVMLQDIHEGRAPCV